MHFQHLSLPLKCQDQLKPTERSRVCQGQSDHKEPRSSISDSAPPNNIFQVQSLEKKVLQPLLCTDSEGPPKKVQMNEILALLKNADCSPLSFSEKAEEIHYFKAPLMSEIGSIIQKINSPSNQVSTKTILRLNPYEGSTKPTLLYPKGYIHLILT